ncbi:hypothetical protein ACFSTE_19395 [Aquimarina hainanensis]|uniref:NADH-quinone oxidoreductase subunit E n=1 Tax=Aquimarina hainanensis TaxID=1578017 RepID=A0ABW5NDT1_9FLAO|nr:hypothetical protein [Aquimarina sp. TRL1]QKX06513.1 hypothetical protein HN014_16850 [Aquimarina sp. TRL1]
MFNFLQEANWWCLLLLLFLAFLLGWLLSRWSLKKKYKSALDQCLKEKETLENTKYKTVNTTFSTTASTDIESDDSIKAIKTRDRQGTPVDIVPAETPKLNFESFGRADASQKDDLKLINGIGPFIEEKLNSIGIYTFDQISRFTSQDIETVTELIQFFPGRIERDNWKKQASKLKDKN